MVTLGIIIGNRGFFPAHLCESGRKEILRVLEQQGFKVVTLPADATRFGAVESFADAQKCADLFQQHRAEIDGVLVTLPNFGDERAVANTLRWAGRPDIDWKEPNRQPIGGEWTNAVNWRRWVGKAGDDWNAANFWAPGHVPTANDNVYIDQIGQTDIVVIRYDSGINSPVAVSNLTSSAHLSFAYPPLTATGTILVNNKLDFTTVRLRGVIATGPPRWWP